MDRKVICRRLGEDITAKVLVKLRLHVRRALDCDAAVWAYELPARYLINPVLPRIPALLLNHESILEAAATDAVLDVLLEQRARGQRDWR